MGWMEQKILAGLEPEDDLLEPAMEGRAPASLVEAASRRLDVFGKRPGGRFYFGVARALPSRV